MGYHPEDRSIFWLILKSEIAPTPMPTLQYPSPTFFAPKHSIFAIQDTRLGHIKRLRFHKATLPPANHPDPPRLLPRAGTPSVPRSSVPTTSRRPADCTTISARLLPPRRGPECGRSTSTRPQGAAVATASCPCARQ